MVKILRTALLGLSVLVALSLSALAAPFDAKAFEDAQAANKTILIDVFATWCPVCAKQRPIVDSIRKERSDLVVFEVNYDAAKDALKRLGSPSHATLIVFKGKKELGRLTGETDPGRIKALVAKGY